MNLQGVGYNSKILNNSLVFIAQVIKNGCTHLVNFLESSAVIKKKILIFLGVFLSAFIVCVFRVFIGF